MIEVIFVVTIKELKEVCTILYNFSTSELSAY